MDKKTKELLERFAQRLIDNNARSRSYFLGMLKAVDSIDLVNYADLFNPNFNLNIAINQHTKMVFPFNPLIPRKVMELCSEKESLYLEKKNSFKKNIEELIPIITEKDLQLLYNDLGKDSLQNIIEELCQKYEDPLKDKYLGIDKLAETSKLIERESARNDLYIGYPFIEGRFFNGKVFRGPLILHSVNLEISPHLKVIKFNETVYLNPVFIISYLAENRMPHQRFDFELTHSKDIIKSTVKFLKDRLALKIDLNTNNRLQLFNSCTKPTYEKNFALYPGDFKITNNAIIGIFPISSKSIYYDLKNISETENINPLLKNFLSKHHKDTPIMEYFNQNEEIQTREEKLELIGEADITQKMIIRDSLNNNLVIQGPPGTGKSQTIVNVISTHVAKGKNVLVISEKKTAIDVIYNRLEGLAPFALIIRNLEKEKGDFYKQIDNTLEAIKKMEKEPEESKNKVYQKNKIINNFFVNMHKYHDVISNNYDGYDFNEISRNQKYPLSKENQSKIKHFSQINESFSNKINDVFKDDYFNGYMLLKEELEKYRTYELFKYDMHSIEKIKKIFSLNIQNSSKRYLFHRVYYGLPINNYNIPTNIAIFGFQLNKELKNKYKVISQEILSLNLDLFKENSVNYFDSELLDFISQNALTKSQLTSLYQRYLYDNASKGNKDILKFIQNYEENCNDVQAAMIEKEGLCQRIITRKVVKNIVENSELDKNTFEGIKELQRLANLQRRKGIPYVLDKTFPSLKTLYPIWLMTPEVASAILPVQTDIFDCLIFDEASQMFIENAVPAIYRAKKVVIAGDAKQLRPSSVFSSRYVEDSGVLDSEKMEKYNIAALEEESLLDYAAHKYMQKYLRYHYRSEQKDLIEFSSRAFYNNQLFFSSCNNYSYEKPLEVIRVNNGMWEDGVNYEEALVVVNSVLSILKTKNKMDTVGIITFNEQQKKLIMDLLIKESIKNESEELRLLLLNELSRIDELTNEDFSLFVKNIENVQGDERDIIIFSITYAKNRQGKLNTNFGLLSMNAGENRLNVAITRAKKKIIIVKSFLSYELVINEKNKGPYFFKKYLEYVEYVSENMSNEKQKLLNSLYRPEESNNIQNSRSALTDDIYEKLQKKIDKNKFYIECDLETGTFNLDLAILSKKTSKVIMAIKCDSSLQSENLFDRENDFYCDRYLTSRGWRIVRIFSSNWWKNPNLEIKKVLDYLP